MFGIRKKTVRAERERIPIYTPAECLGDACEFYSGETCNSRMELLEAKGKSGGKNQAPLRDDCSYALYGQVCMGGEEQVVVSFHADSPNGEASAMELVGRMGRHEEQRIVLDTPQEAISFQ